jgi:uncharacterized membrane protein YkvA (DUF1232 family)
MDVEHDGPVACHRTYGPHVKVRACAVHGMEVRMLRWGLLLTRFRKELLLAWSIFRDARTPTSAKLATLAAVLYVLSPVDVLPDLIPVLGWLDDGILALLLLKLAQRLLPGDLLTSLKAKIDQRTSTVHG